MYKTMTVVHAKTDAQTNASIVSIKRSSNWDRLSKAQKRIVECKYSKEVYLKKMIFEIFSSAMCLGQFK